MLSDASSHRSKLVVRSGINEEIRRRAGRGGGIISPPALLVGLGNHAYWLHGVHALDGDDFYAVRHGNKPVALLSKDEFASIGANALWLPHCDHDVAASVSVGGSRVALMPQTCDVGLIAPFQSATSHVIVSNIGSNPVEVVGVDTSCGCTGAEFVPDIRRLEPGATATLRISLASRNTPSVKERVTLTLRDPLSSETETALADLDVFGYQFPVLEISTKELQFGPVRQGGIAAARFRLSQTKADRFHLEKITAARADGIEIDTRVSERPNGLKTYNVECKWSTSSLSLGRFRGALAITTSSKWRPELELPIAISVRPDIDIVPAGVSFGAVEAMREQHMHAFIRVRSKMQIDGVQPLNVREGMRVVIGPHKDGRIPVDIWWLPRRRGEIKHLLVFLLKTGSESFSVKLPCTGRVGAAKRSPTMAGET